MSRSSSVGVKMLNGHANPSQYAEQLELFKQNDTARDAFIQDLIRDYEELKIKFEQTKNDYDNEVESRRMWQSKASLNERALAEQRQASGCNSFVLALIDGDGAIFQDFLYALGKEGGADAAHKLHSEIKRQLKTTYPDGNVDDWKIAVQIVLNLPGLASKLQACGIVTNTHEVLEFARAFGLAQPLFSFIDVGIGKERADHKIRETLRLFLPNAQCKHVFFGPCSDNGYLPVLETYKRDYASKLTLIETRPAEQGFIDLGLERVRFPRVFRSDNLPCKPLGVASPAPIAPPVLTTPLRSTSVQLQPNSTVFVPQNASPSPAPSSDSGTSTSWATIGKSGSTVKTINVASKKPPTRRHVLLNVYDERLDAELPKCDSSAEKRFSERLKANGKFCNNFHLIGKCDSGEYCDYNHGERLSPGEQLVLKHKARSRSCPQKSTCRDLSCTYGHHCKFGTACFLDNCWFVETHGMDMQPAKRFYEDETEEWIPAYLKQFHA